MDALDEELKQKRIEEEKEKELEREKEKERKRKASGKSPGIIQNLL